MSTDDLTFITNEKGKSLLNRFESLIKDTQFFDCLVGYFYTSGFYAMYKSLKKTEKIRVLIGISTDRMTYDLIQDSKSEVQQKLDLSHKEAKEEFSQQVVQEMEHSKDSFDIEEGIRKFIEWLRSGKLQIRVYPSEKIHAKLYIMTFKEGDRDIGRVITGSSNFTQAGLQENLEFNVELKNSSDYKFAIEKFNELWKNSVDVSEKYVETIKDKTWLNDEITPYELYLKFLYEYLKEKINIDKDELFRDYLPENFMDLEYQKDAVKDAKMKLDEFGGVFISDVVGLGKTYISAMLAQQLDGGTLVIAPPVLLDKDNPGSWRNVFFEFGVRKADFESIGMLDKVIQRGTEKYKNIIIDEAHRFRTESTQMYEKMFEICRGKRVILVSATPLNNTPLDILTQIKLFQNAHKSTLPNPKVKDLERYFKRLQNRLKGLDRQKDKEEYLRIIKENAEEIRENILQYLMVRRTRNSISKYYRKDLQNQGLKFPDVEDPRPIVYNFNEELDKIFNKTLELIIKGFKYSRYTPLLYLKEGVSQPEELSQRNMGRFMKILLLKRLESSFFAFKQSISRFVYSYKRFIEEYNKGHVFVSKKYINKVFEFLEEDDKDSIQNFIDEEKAHKYLSKDFLPSFIKDLEHDFQLLEKIEGMWRNVNEDPKLDKFIDIISKDKVLKQNKLIVFTDTESKETAEYLESKLNPKFENKAIVFSSDSSEFVRTRIIENYDANYRKQKQKDDIRILVSTVLREIRDKNADLFDKIKKLPKKARTAKKFDIKENSVLTFFRKGKLRKIFMTNGNIVEEVDFLKTAEILKSEKDLKREKLDVEFYKHLESNKKEFNAVFMDEGEQPKGSGGRSQEAKLIKIIKAVMKSKEFTDDDEEYLQEVLRLLKEGGIAKATIKRVVGEIGNEINPLKILAKVKSGISPSVFQGTFAKSSADISGPKEIILSEYLIKNG